MLQNSPEFCKALKLVIKFQISTLLQQLAESGEESVVLTANIGEGTADHLGSDKGSSFLAARDELQRQFLNYCTDSPTEGAEITCRKQHTSSNYGDDTFSGHLLSPSQIACNPLLSPTTYHKAATVRPRYERESSTSDSVFSPHRRKSSASSRSLEDENLFTSSDYQETKKSMSESDTCFREWPNQPSNLPVKSPSCEDNNSLRVLTLSSPSTFQYRKQTKSVSRMSVSSADLASVSSSEKVSPSPGRVSNSSSSSENLDTINTIQGQGQKTGTCQRSPVDFYKTQGCGSSGFTTPQTPRTPTPSTPTISINEAAVGASSPNVYKMPYEPSELKSPFLTSEPKFRYGVYETEHDFTNPYSLERDRKVTNLGDYESYNVPKAVESKDYREGYSYKTHSQETLERKHTDSENVPVFKIEDNADDLSRVKSSEDTERPQEIDTGVIRDEAYLSPDYRAYSFGLLSPLQRSFLYGGRGISRERSQSLSEVGNLTKEELGTVTHRARFPSSSFVENLDTPLIIDYEVEGESYGGLDLRKKRRKLSETYQPADDQTEANPASESTNTDDKELQEKPVYESSGVDSSVKKYGKGNFIKVATGYQCRICCRVIRHMNNTTAHMRIHANLKPYKCQVCNQQFKYEVDRRYHFSKQHVDLFAKMYFPDIQDKAPHHNIEEEKKSE